MNGEMLEGQTDGTYKKMPPNRTGVEAHEDQERRLQQWPYGFYQAPYMITGDGRRVRPSKVSTGWDIEGKSPLRSSGDFEQMQ
jgi:hypothetical protein